MIARFWRGVTHESKADRYLEYLEATGVEDCLATPGNLGVQILRRTTGEHAEFLFISFWDSYDAIRGFAGEDIGRAVYYPEDKEFLLELEPEVQHYEITSYGSASAATAFQR